MASYPSFAQLVGSKFDGSAGVEVKRARGGRPRLKHRFSKVFHVAEIKHELSREDLDTLLAFYDTNKVIPFDFTWVGDGEVYSMVFAEYPKAKAIGGNYYEVEVQMIEDV